MNMSIRKKNSSNTYKSCVSPTRGVLLRLGLKTNSTIELKRGDREKWGQGVREEFMREIVT